MGRVSKIPEIEARIGQPLGKYLADLIKQGKKPPEIASEIGVSLSNTYDYITKFGLKAKLLEVAQANTYATKGGELKDAIDEFILAKQAGERSPKTIVNYQTVLYSFLRWLDNNKKPATLGAYEHTGAQLIRDFLFYLQDTTQANTRRFYWTVFRTFSLWLIRQEKIEKNPITKTDKPRVPKRMPEDLPDEIIMQMLDSFDGSFDGIRNKTIMLVFLDCGLRLQGITDLKVSDFNLETGWCQVIEKGDKERPICLSSTMLKQLHTYLALRNPLTKPDCDWLWVTAKGERFGRHHIKNMVLVLKRTIDSRIHPHLFRHIWTKKMVESDVPPAAMMRMGGWANLDLVMHYASAYSQEKAWVAHEKASPVTKLLGVQA